MKPRRNAGRRQEQGPGAPNPPGFAARSAAVGILSSVLDGGHALDAALDPTTGDRTLNRLEPRDRRLVHAIVATALRRHGELDAVLDRLIEHRPRRSGRLIRILEIAAAQLLYMEVPDHAAVSIALDQLSADHDGAHFKGLANAVLRRMARERETILADQTAPGRNTPDWLWRRWVATYGEETAAGIAAAHLVEPALDLSVRRDPEEWAKTLGGIVLPTGSVRLIPSGAVEELPGYADGAWWVQDAAAALPAKLMGSVAGKRVADLCAAPGGKTAALSAAGARVTSVDIAPDRLRRLSANLARLRLVAETVPADILDWAPPEPFDAILLDAPCTATGTIRRHPDIAWLKRPDDVPALAALQARMIDRAVAWLKPGGILVYCTCSLEPEEGEAQFARAIQRHGLEVLPVDPAEIGSIPGMVTSAGTVRTLPTMLPLDTPRLSGLDGFFIGRLRRR